MSDTLINLRRKITGAEDLESVVRTMKILAASNILHYEMAVTASADYYRAVEQGLLVCFYGAGELVVREEESRSGRETTGAVIFGSDQGLVGQFNDLLAEFAVANLQKFQGEKRIWAVGERMQTQLENAGVTPEGTFSVPHSVKTITPLAGKILLESDAYREKGEMTQFFVFHNKPETGAVYKPTVQRILPLDEQWLWRISRHKWPTEKIPEAMHGVKACVHGLIRNYLFISLFRACAESLASENASRLAAMQRAEKNIGELLEELHRVYHRLRQSTIDEELFDVISGSEALAKEISPAG